MNTLAGGTGLSWKSLFVKMKKPIILIALLLLIRIPVGIFPDIFQGRETLVYQSLTVLTFFILAYIVSHIFEASLEETSLKDKITIGIRTVLYQVLRVFVYALAALLALEHFGISVTPILASLGIGSIAIALALQDTLGNLFSGFYILVDQPFEVGHTVKVEPGGVEGRVVHVGWRSTRIAIASGDMVIVPNSKISSSVLTNRSLPNTETMVQIKVGVRANQDLMKVERVCLNIAQATQNHYFSRTVKEFEPTVRFLDVVGSSVDVQVSVRAKDDNMAGLMRHDLIRSLVLAMQREGIVLRIR